MPLHLLGKKSWNVYNTDNIARVRRDEAAAQAKEDEQERKWRDEDASKRISLLRGDQPQPLSQDNEPERDEHVRREKQDRRKKRRLVGEDDTDRDLRLARDRIDDVQHRSPHSVKHREDSHTRHIDSKPIGDDTATQGMRFRDAGGYQDTGTGPWYAKSHDTRDNEQSQVGRDVWGNEDPRRREREESRLATNDPLLAMKRGVKRLRENEREREAWKRQRENDLYEVELLARSQKKAGRHQRDDDVDESDLEDFRLDDEILPADRDLHKWRRRHNDTDGSLHQKKHHRRRSRSPDRDHRRHRRHRHRTTDTKNT